ncbi:hypothetical protein K456DRAFT_47205 [Colletotrichum gloeosporioides 23]|nr:hypothetical protein K456DRAFT_47205 [Colletotrichum gloeosporioides 23]
MRESTLHNYTCSSRPAQPTAASFPSAVPSQLYRVVVLLVYLSIIVHDLLNCSSSLMQPKSSPCAYHRSGNQRYLCFFFAPAGYQNQIRIAAEHRSRQHSSPPLYRPISPDSAVGVESNRTNRGYLCRCSPGVSTLSRAASSDHGGRDCIKAVTRSMDTPVCHIERDPKTNKSAHTRQTLPMRWTMPTIFNQKAGPHYLVRYYTMYAANRGQGTHCHRQQPSSSSPGSNWQSLATMLLR